MKTVTLTQNILLITLFNFFPIASPSQTFDAPQWVKDKLPRDVSALDRKDSLFFQSWIDQNALLAIDYLISKCKQHQLVVLGEMHEIQNNLLFIKDALPILHRETGLNCLGLEVCNAEDNPDLERLVNAPTYDETLALSIARSNNWHFWGWKEYWDLLRAVWQINQTVGPTQSRLKVVGIGRKMNLILDFKGGRGMLRDSIETAAYKAQLPLLLGNDSLMASEAEKEILQKGLRGLILVGNMHAFTHYRQPLVRDGKYVSQVSPRMCYLLHKKYEDRIFQITLHLDEMSPVIVDPSYNGPNPTLPALIETLMTRRAIGPIGFDVFCSPLGSLRDSASYYFHYQPTVVFSDVCRGYIVLVPWRKIQHCDWIPGFITPEMFKANKDFFDARFNKKFSSADEVNEFFSYIGKPH